VDDHFLARGITSRNQRLLGYLDSTWAVHHPDAQAYSEMAANGNLTGHGARAVATVLDTPGGFLKFAVETFSKTAAWFI
jgi:hypothetical protein